MLRTFLLIGIALSIFSCGKRPAITFEVHLTSELKEGEHVYITGNHRYLGTWKPDSIRLDKVANRKWSITRPFSKGTQLEYKFTKGTWTNEAIGKDGVVPSNHTFLVTRFNKKISHTIDGWKDKNHAVAGQITGNLKYHKGLTPKGLLKRNVVVWLPPSYDSAREKRYPVLYAHDGQNIFDPSTAFLGHDWQLDEVTDSLIKAGKLEEFIVVGIENSIDRSEEYAPTKKGTLYMDFLCHRLKPMIDSLYRTKPAREHTMTMGSSMGGLISFMLIWERPTIFGKAACLSPAFKYKNFDYTQTVKQYRGPKHDFDVYLDNGTKGLEAKLQPGIDLMMNALTNKRYAYDWFLDEGAEHNEMAWAKRVWRPLVFLAGSGEKMENN